MTPTELAKSGTEHAHQRALFAWAAMAERYCLAIANDPKSYTMKGYAEREWQAINAHHPGYIKDKKYWQQLTQLKWLHAIHNQGHGDAVRGARAKAEGVKAGVADIFLPVPKFGPLEEDEYYTVMHYAGLYIELKRADKGQISKEQSEFAFDMSNAGYKHCFCYGWEAARDAIIEYLGLHN